MAKKKLDIDFTQAFQQLQEIAEWFERGEPNLDEGLKKFETAMEMTTALRERLTEAENTVKEIRQRHTGAAQDSLL